MAKRRVSPNRMELMQLNKELQMARRGHRMLKDKRDGLMRQFIALVDRNVALRKEVDKLLAEAAVAMAMAQAVMQPEVLGQALQLSADAVSIQVKTRQIMAVEIPEFKMEAQMQLNEDAFPYGLASTSGEMDMAILLLQKAFPIMLELAEAEKEVQLLAGEIEKTRRRVNSLEHVMMPDLVELIKEIKIKMDENERGNLTRLMKVKDLIVAQEIENRRKRDEQASLVAE